MMEKIKFIPDNGDEAVEFYVLEQTRIGGVDYLLVTDCADETEDAEAYILKDLSSAQDEQAVYEFVEDEEELETVSALFADLLEDTDLEI